MGNQDWGHAHHEQAGTFRGTITCGTETIPFDGTGFRDHTNGPRDFANLRRTFWAHGVFPGGRAFALLRIWDPQDDMSLNQGFGFDGDKLIPALPAELPSLTAPAVRRTTSPCTRTSTAAARSGSTARSCTRRPSSGSHSWPWSTTGPRSTGR